MDKLGDLLETIEDTLNAAAPDMLRIQQKLGSLWTNFGHPQVQHLMERLPMPPLPPPPPPPPQHGVVIQWLEKNPGKACGIAVGLCGSLLVGYGMHTIRQRKVRAATVTGRHWKVVVVLGGDHPLGAPLIGDLERKGYKIITSVSTPEAADQLESAYVRALVLDPSEPAGIHVFLRSMATTLSRHFPLSDSGTDSLTVCSIVSLLSLRTPPPSAPLENSTNFQNDYLPYLTATQITPLQVIQSILPLFRGVSGNQEKSIIVCLPATATRVGLPFSSIQSMSATGTLRAIEVLRREITAAGITGKSESMKNINVVVVEVGAFDVGPPPGPDEVYRSMEQWSVSEKLTYGPAFAAISHRTNAPQSRWESFKGHFSDSTPYGVRRKPTSAKVFVDSVVCVVTNGASGVSFLGCNVGLGRLRNLVMGHRFSVGAGSHTYKYASFLPSLVLDALLNIPHLLIALRNSLLPVERATPPLDLPPVEPVAPVVPAEAIVWQEDSTSDVGSEADAEGTDASASWVRLHGRDL